MPSTDLSARFVAGLIAEGQSEPFSRSSLTDGFVPGGMLRSPICSEARMQAGCGHIVFKGGLRLLDDADVVAILDQNLVNAFPTGTICPGTVNENDIPNAMLYGLR
jgi:hypothetical protein